MTKIGQFTIQGETITGPKDYMTSKHYESIKDKITSGHSTVVAEALAQGKDIETAILVAVQTDYAGWRGTLQSISFKGSMII